MMSSSPSMTVTSNPQGNSGTYSPADDDNISHGLSMRKIALFQQADHFVQHCIVTEKD